ncbi:hypothetical protein E0L20_21785 [Enterobacter wuhouensis]|uniref:Uncharacterized protein n=1 Tax=Enterobacter wuhouensis TaxID=2529381 RepID=A0A4V2LUD1_9ENTR|nr:hypothetical protein BWI76_21720 [Klebsiella sp. M5al]KAA0493435.1 hypothetical protein F0332_09530 [Klebsiella grimontii]MBX4674079.1 hypothetical protein [Klebsiella sp. CVUAS 5466.2]MBZ7243394.1 hypothetical protein [Klebsiella michiganensis]MBZ7532430.1 hypothetical protein [Klebsiella variicola]PEN26904.1 hypothetical protein CMQ96_02225 [Klebsiella sp. MBT K-1]RFP47756.1 hypothetical protein DDJ34_07730 [Klebsiella oxytoca]TCB88255.1 hypothetical protein E0L20_21785 [Enterobacter wu
MPLFIDECCGLTGAYRKAGCRRRKAASPSGSEATSPAAGHERKEKHFNNQPLQFVVPVQKALVYQSLPGPWSKRVPLPMA